MSSAVTVQNPFPGLRPYTAEESTLFFGRDEQTGEALDRLLRRKLLAVVGVSGCGKSSLVGAGMVPALEMGLAGDPEQRWRVAAMRPGDGPLRELARCLDFGGHALAERTYGLLEAVETQLPPDENLLLVVDQFEEIFPFRDRKLLEGAGSEADLFVNYLLRASQDPAGRVYVLLTMRSDYMGECAKFHGLPEALNDGQYLVPRMTRQQLQEAIEGPLQAAAVEIHPAVVQDLLNQCGEEPDNLPVLQHLLRRMFEQWQQEGGRGLITAAIAESLGGLVWALDRDAEDVYGGLPSEEKRVAEMVFRRITESRRQSDREEDDRPVRRPQTLLDLAILAGGPEAVHDTVCHFQERGLLVVRKTDRGEVVDLPHECLCLKWDRLKGWIRSEAEDAKKLRFLLDSVGTNYLAGLALSEALEWKGSGRLESGWGSRYLTHEQLSGVVDWVTQSQRRVTEAEEKERRQKEEREAAREERVLLAQAQRRRARLFAIVIGVAFLIAVALGLVAYFQKRRADVQAATAVLAQGRAQAEATRANELRLSSEIPAMLKAERGGGTERALQELMAGHALVPKSVELDGAMSFAMTMTRGLKKIVDIRARVHSVQFSPDGTRIVSGDGDGAVRLWDAKSLSPIGSPLVVPGYSVSRVSFSPDGTRIISSSTERNTHDPRTMLQLWDASTGSPIGSPLAGTNGQMAFSPDGTLIVAGSSSGVLLRWDGKTGQPIGHPLRGHKGSVNGVAFNHDSSRIVSGGEDGTLRLWDSRSGMPVGSPLRGEAKKIKSVAFSPDGSHILSGDASGLLQMWDANSEALVSSAHDKENEWVEQILYNRDGSRVAALDLTGTLRLFDMKSGRGIGLFVNDDPQIECMAFSPDGSKIATGGLDKLVRLWDAKSGKPIGEPLAGHNDYVWSVAFSPDGSRIVSGSLDGTLRLWDTKNEYSIGMRLQPIEAVGQVAFNPEGSRIIAAGSLGPLFHLWDAKSGQHLSAAPPKELKSRLLWVAYTPNGMQIVSGDDKGFLRLWDGKTLEPIGTPVTQLKGWAKDSVESVAVSPDTSQIVFGSKDGSLQLWSLKSGDPIGTPFKGHKGGVTSIDFSRDGSRIVSGGEDGSVRLWDSKSGRAIGSPLIGHKGKVAGVAFNSDGSEIVSSGDDNTLRLWNAKSGSPIGVLEGTESLVENVIFNADGSQIFSGDIEGFLRVWDAKTGQPIGGPLKDRAPYILTGIRSLVVSPDGNQILAGTDSGLILWPAPRTWAELLCAKLTRNMTREEWRAWISPSIEYKVQCRDLPVPP